MEAREVSTTNAFSLLEFSPPESKTREGGKGPRVLGDVGPKGRAAVTGSARARFALWRAWELERNFWQRLLGRCAGIFGYVLFFVKCKKCSPIGSSGFTAGTDANDEGRRRKGKKEIET